MTVVVPVPRSAMFLRYTGTLRGLSSDERRALLARIPARSAEVRSVTAEIIRDVGTRGDDALRDLARRFDGVDLGVLEVDRTVRRRALDALSPNVRRAMERSAGNIARVHSAFLPAQTEVSPEPGIIIGRRPDPLGRVGVYAPGGRASYPSSVLMGAVPARVAGVGEVILCSPPNASGCPSPVVLAAAELASVDRVFAVGGAGAIAAMALGTASIPRVDKVVGPGNAYVTEAKLQLVGVVAIDSPAGPSEILVIADATSDAEAVAAEIIAQAEHDPLACLSAVCIGPRTAEGVIDCLESQLETLPMTGVITRALTGQGAVLSASSLSEAVDFANEYAPEHLILAVEDADAIVDRLRNAGTIIWGAGASVAFGDYMTGANHVLPTGGLARAYSGLSTLDFIRWTTYQRIDRSAAADLADDTMEFASAEGLPAHARAAGRWRTGA